MAESFKGALRKVAADYRRALPRAVERGTIFAAGVTFALMALSNAPWTIAPLGFLIFAVQGTVIALLIGVRVDGAALGRAFVKRPGLSAGGGE